jgi:hypothetical protein
MRAKIHSLSHLQAQNTIGDPGALFFVGKDDWHGEEKIVNIAASMHMRIKAFKETM